MEPYVVTPDRGECVEDWTYNETDIEPGPYDYLDDIDAEMPAVRLCPAYSTKVEDETGERCVCNDGFERKVSPSTNMLVACHCPEGEEIGGNEQNKCVPLPESSALDRVAHQCAIDCDEEYFELCEAEIFTNGCMDDCDAQLVYAYQSFFSQLCPQDFEMPAMTVVEVDSSLVLDEISRITIEEGSRQELLYFLTVLGHGLAEPMDGVTWENILISRLDGILLSDIQSDREQGGGRRTEGEASEMLVEFAIVVPIANLADGQAKAVPKAGTDEGKTEEAVLVNAMWKQLRESVTVKSPVAQGIEEVGEFPGDLGTAMKATSVKTLANPHMEYDTTGKVEVIQDGDSGKGKFKLSEKEESILFIGGGALIAVAAVFGMWKASGGSGEEVKQKHHHHHHKSKNGGKKVPHDHKRPTVKLEMKSVMSRGESVLGGSFDESSGNDDTMNPMGDPRLAQPVAPDVPEPWDPVWDKEQQRYYFYNHDNGTTQWEVPRAGQI
jgi:hypothetical protein